MDEPEYQIGKKASRRLFRCMIGVFFIGGFLNSSVSLLVPSAQLALGLGYTRALTIQLAYHSSYLIFALPLAFIIARWGYLVSIAAGLFIMVLATAGIAAALEGRSFTGLLATLLLLSIGVTILQIASNSVVTLVGPSGQGAKRLTFLQGFNAVGTVLGPILCAPFILGKAGTGPFAAAFGGALPFVSCALFLSLLSWTFARNRTLLREPAPTSIKAPRASALRHSLENGRLMAGCAAIFLYVGAEVTIGALLPSLLMLPGGLGAEPILAGRLVSLYWLGAMVGRFGGAFLMSRISEIRLVAVAGIGAVLLSGVASQVPGLPGAMALLAIGLCNSIMYPAIFAFALPRTPQLAPVGSMLLCMAVVGGSIIPMLTGLIADRTTLMHALVVPMLCYAGITVYALRGSRVIAQRTV